MKRNSDIRLILRNSQGECGVALLYALGILSIVLVVVMIFTSRTKTELKVASAYSDAAAAKNIGQTGLIRALHLLKVNGETGNRSSCSDSTTGIVLGEEGNAATRYRDWLWKIMDSYNSTDGWLFPNGEKLDDYRTIKNNLSWNYLKDGEKILGRYAFAIIGGNRMNLNAFGDHSACSGTSKCDSAEPECGKHNGVSLAEVNVQLKSGDETFLTHEKLREENLHYAFKKDGDKDVADPANNTLYKNTNLAESSLGISDNSDAKLKLNQKFFVSDSTGRDPERYYSGGTDDDGKKIYYHRFNLKRTDWDTVTPEKILEAPKEFEPNDMDKFTPGSEGGIPWLIQWSNAGEMVNAETAKKQIIANLINYCSPDTRAPVSDVTELWEPTAQPTYTGLKRTPYINEFFLKIDASATWEKTNTGTAETPSWHVTVHYALHVSMLAEVVKMYQDILGGTMNASAYPLKVFGGFTYSCKNSLNTYGTSVTTWQNLQSIDTAKWLDFNSSGTGYHSYKLDLQGNNSGSNPGDEVYTITFDSSFDTGTTEPTWNEAVGLRLDSCKFDGIRLCYGSQNADYSILNISLTNVSKAIPESDQATFVIIDCQAKDPRQNLNIVDWDTNTSASGHTIGSRNSNLPTAVDLGTMDPEILTSGVLDPAWRGDGKGEHISTAYIRHAPMESLWELGAIHRAAAWQTLNLKVDTTGVYTGSDLNGGGTYANGDGAILDEVKLTDKSSVTGKINLNMDQSGDHAKYFFGSLLADFPFHKRGHYDSDAKTNTSANIEDEGGNVDPLIGKFIDALKAVTDDGRKIVDSRSLILQNDTFKNAFVKGSTSVSTSESIGTALSTVDTDATVLNGFTTDALQEQLVGRTINLLKTDENCFESVYIIVLAQSIKDVEGPVFKSWNDDGNVAAAPTSIQLGKQSYAGVASPFTDGATYPTTGDLGTAALGKYKPGADQITGETKIVAEAVWDKVNKTWKIVSVRYVE